MKKQKVQFTVTLTPKDDKVNKKDVINEISQLLAASTHGEFKVIATPVKKPAKA